MKKTMFFIFLIFSVIFSTSIVAEEKKINSIKKTKSEDSIHPNSIRGVFLEKKESREFENKVNLFQMKINLMKTEIEYHKTKKELNEVKSAPKIIGKTYSNVKTNKISKNTLNNTKVPEGSKDIINSQLIIVSKNPVFIIDSIYKIKGKHKGYIKINDSVYLIQEGEYLPIYEEWKVEKIDFDSISINHPDFKSKRFYIE